MPLSAGSRLGPYEIRERLGAGGMGELYRAHDPRLGRDVALKVILTEGEPSAERLKRFDGEPDAAQHGPAREMQPGQARGEIAQLEAHGQGAAEQDADRLAQHQPHDRPERDRGSRGRRQRVPAQHDAGIGQRE